MARTAWIALQGDKIKVLTNASCTIYHRTSSPSDGRDVFEKTYIPECWWYLQNKSVINNGGMTDQSVLTIRIYDLNVKVKKGDYIVKGECLVDMVTVKDLKAYEYFKITLANHNDFGDNQHIKVVAS